MYMKLLLQTEILYIGFNCSLKKNNLGLGGLTFIILSGLSFPELLHV